MQKIKKLFKNTRIVLAIIIVVLALVAIRPNPWAKGVTIRSVIPNSSAAQAGIESPNPATSPMARERIIAINNIPVYTLNDFERILADIPPNVTVHIKTNRAIYRLRTRANETSLGLSVYEAPMTNLRKGLDLQGGTRVLLQPEIRLSPENMSLVIENMKRRLNVYGLSDIIVRSVEELPPPFGEGNQYILVEIAGAKEEEVKELISKQGKFEAKIANKTVFMGGEDIRHVCRSPDCAGIDPTYGCKRFDQDWICRFRFAITLSTAAAKRQAEATANLSIITEAGERYLSEKILLFLDDKLVDELRIAAELRGKETTDIAISGSGIGPTREQALINAFEQMKRLQTILITGSLPIKLSIVKTDTISPLFGKESVINTLTIGLLALCAIIVIILCIYRKLAIAVPMVLTCIAEVVILLGIAALIGWNLDLAAIAGIIIAVGTGVDDQIVITSEALKGGAKEKIYDWKARIKKAFFIIMAAYFTTLVAMLPLWFAGAGLLKGFAITTIIGISIGVFITRPAYAAAIEILLKE